jgi:hypothetical protein
VDKISLLDLAMDGFPLRVVCGRIPWGLVGMVGLVVAIEAALERRAGEFSGSGSWSWRVSGREAARQARDADILCCGDSLVKLGVVPQVIEERLGLRTYNLSACAAQAPTSYFLLRRALEAGARPAALLVDYKPDLLLGGPQFNLRQWQEMIGVGEGLELAWNARDAGFFAAALLGRILPSYRARFEIRARILAALRGEPYALTDDSLRHSRNWEANRGCEVFPSSPHFDGSLDPALAARYQLDKVWCNRINKVYIDKLINLARSQGIAVFWLIPPAAPVVEAKRARFGTDAHYTRFVREVQARHSNLNVIDGRRCGYGDSAFWDPVHLNREGALTFTAAVADVLARHAAGQLSRRCWAELPALAPRPVEYPVEDLDQSAVTLGLPPERVRR